ncbi:E3 ubiquitin-protein ligase SH3RF3 [Podarcis lilfordi]|uniref:E3 ubiquitin-protein ligase SH3RF3 n=1 Tax=Podarcis lilfordi TaxID=74358 RepID=A0AA35K6G0_9SAUR|nr:E3 ubiquitin-protein ligase SH3RF3 [Podarcis lilfordi]
MLLGASWLCSSKAAAAAAAEKRAAEERRRRRAAGGGGGGGGGGGSNGEGPPAAAAAAACGGAMDESSLLDLLECSVCLERLDTTAKVLPCQHTFCRRCLESIVSSRHELRCPECRILVGCGVDELPANILLVRLLDGIRQRPRAAAAGNGAPGSPTAPGNAAAPCAGNPAAAGGNNPVPATNPACHPVAAAAATAASPGSPSSAAAAAAASAAASLRELAAASRSALLKEWGLQECGTVSSVLTSEEASALLKDSVCPSK